MDFYLAFDKESEDVKIIIDL